VIKAVCPSCGAEVSFKSRASVLAVCSFCNSTLVRHDLNLENLGKMTEMPLDLSPLKIGTRGTYQGAKFEIVGRQRIGWSDGAWNEWYLVFENGDDAWLADAQGFYMLSRQRRDITELPSRKTMYVGYNATLDGRNYKVDDVREVECVGSEGELPVKSVVGRKSLSVDLVGKDQTYAGLDYSVDENRVFIGSYQEFDAFNFENLRELDGW
jgi:Domain of unknown function (DUF4178)